MKVKIGLLFSLFFIGILATEAQEKTKLSLQEAINLGLSQSSEVHLADIKVATKKLELETMKNNRYPNVKVSGQFLKLGNAKINSNLNNGNSSNSGGSPAKIDQFTLGQINANLPVFSGFKLKYNIVASENLLLSEQAKAEYSKEEVAMQIIEYYANLYRAQKSVDLLTENLKSAKQRVVDFTNLEKNEIIARNDLLKAQLQESKVQLSLDEAYKNVSVYNYYLTTILKLSSDYRIEIDENQFGNNEPINLINSDETAFKNRKDLEAIHFLQRSKENEIKVAKSAYYPSFTFIGGYAYLDLKNAITVSNAMNYGVGLSYDLTSIFKNGANVKAAKSRALETHEAETILTDKIKIQMQLAIENYNFALKQNLVYKLGIDQASENYRIVKDKYDNGLSNTTDLLEADVEQLNTKINYAFSRANIMLKYYEMQSASGQLLSSFKITKN